VLAGTANPNQPVLSNPGRPLSERLGTFGNCLTGLAEVTPMALIWPDLTKTAPAVRFDTIKSI